MKRFISLSLLLSFIMCVSCGEAQKTPAVTSDTSGPGTSSSEIQTEIKDDLGEYDFGGYEFKIYTRTNPIFYPNIDVIEETGDLLGDAIYKRNRTLEERFNFVFHEEYYDFATIGSDAPRKYLLSGDDSYDMFVGRNVQMFNYASEGMLYTIDELPMINPDKPYWNGQLYSDLSMCGEHYFAVGAFSISSYDFTHVMLFNKGMHEKYGLEDMYTLVREGKWTFDKFAELARTAVDDLNGDSVMDDNDQYGYTSLAKQVLPSFWIAANTVTFKKDDDGKLVYTALKDERFIEVYQKIFSITWEDNIWRRVPTSVDNETQLQLFADGHALFTNSSCHQISTMRDSNVDFGIVPYPKYNEEQEKYYSRIEGCELFGIPLSNRNTEMASVILEAMACESLKDVIPAYYDLSLKVKFTRDNESSEMLDLAFENRVFDYGDTILCTELRDGVLRGAFAADNRNAASILTSAEGTINAKLKTLNDAFEALASK